MLGARRFLVLFVFWGIFRMPLMAGIEFTWADVADVGNPSDSLNSGSVPGIGSVDYPYRISATEVSLHQYTEFLNAVDANGSNSLGLYNANMALDPNISGIHFDTNAASGSKYGYLGAGNRPITYVSWTDAARLVNWLHNGEGNGATESGVYDLSSAFPIRSTSARYALPTENEWYKAAYYDPTNGAGGGDNYWLYPMRTNDRPFSAPPPGNNAPASSRAGNFYEYSGGSTTGYNTGYALTGNITTPSGNVLSDGNAYPDAATYYGTYGQGGNVAEWAETLVSSNRVYRGGSWAGTYTSLESISRSSFAQDNENAMTGFRIVAVPEPSSLVFIGASSLAGILLLRYRRI